MPKFSKRSMEHLNTCDPRLVKLFLMVVTVIDCTVFTGHRGMDEQNEFFRQGKSQLKFPEGKHNNKPSLAADVAPYPIDWKDRERATLFAGFVMGVAFGLHIPLRWGGDWDGDWQVRDNNFDDLWHFEIRD